MDIGQRLTALELPAQALWRSTSEAVVSEQEAAEGSSASDESEQPIPFPQGRDNSECNMLCIVGESF